MEIISIHLMLLLNDNQNVETTINESNFNTSYVVIKLLIVCDISNFERISIHLMLLLNRILFHRLLLKENFNTSYVVIKRGQALRRTYMLNIFQYILCCY